ncbi:outer membrane beta-barrel protein [[Flexibacter] sp. ATCC 35208]|uniref:outer membrane beta-barrel protein n=1 Tax=[Flexibacter] sp. ATCC 35208 TaxID=1936242 RepID=UPI0015C3CEBB|nr:outer membrane beta-barrel protein [[Flexibacter] sp. ATCC 35208]
MLFPLEVVYGQEQPRQLKEITVKAQPQLVRKEIDRVIYDVQSDPDNKVESAIEMLAKVPLLAVDGDGNIRLNGSGKYRIFINGKPSSLMTRNPKEALKSMPALIISKIEVITTPPAKYDGEGLAGIINIITVKQRQNGYNGSLGANFNRYVGTGQHGYLTLKQGKFGVNVYGYLYQDLKMKTNERTTRNSVTSVLSQNADNTYYSRFGAGTAEVSYEMDSLLLFSGSMSYYNSHDHYNSQRTTVLDSITTDNYNSKYLHSGALDINVSLEKGFKRHKKELFTIGYQYHHMPEELTTNNQYNSSLMEEHTLQADYSHPFTRWLMEAGVKWIDRVGGATYDTVSKNRFRYNQQIWSAYNSWQFSSRLLDVRAGVRLEYAVLQRGTYYTSLLPVIAILHAFPHASAGITYSQKVERPSLTQLNPFTDENNPYVYVSGNPFLLPVKQHKVDLSYTLNTKAGFHSMLTYNVSSNDIQQVVAVHDSVSVSSYQNIGRNSSVRLSTGVNFQISGKLRLIANLDAGYQVFNENSGWSASGFVNLAYRISEQWRLTSTVYGATPVITYQGLSNGSVIHVTRLTKTFLHNHLSVSGSVSNPYGRYRYIISAINTDQFHQQNRIQRYYRTFAVSASWNFGHLSGNVRKAQRNIKNEDLEIKSKSLSN